MTNSKSSKLVVFGLVAVAMLVFPFILQATGSNSWMRIVDIALLYVLLAYAWARSVARAEAGDYPAGFKQAKRETARFFFQRLLMPRCAQHRIAIEAGATSLMALDAALFDS